MNKLSTRRAVLFFNGNLADVQFAKSRLFANDFIICADGAADFALQLNIAPHVIIGDFDSLSKFSQEKLRKNQTKWIRFPREKDQTDSALAIEYAVTHNYKSLLIFGLFGSRLDHMLTNIFALENLAANKIDAVCIEGKQELHVFTQSLTLRGKIGEQLSLLPLKGDVSGVTTRGLKYPLHQDNLPFGSSRGVSNIFLTANVDVTIKRGALLAIHTRKG